MVWRIFLFFFFDRCDRLDRRGSGDMEEILGLLKDLDFLFKGFSPGLVALLDQTFLGQ